MLEARKGLLTGVLLICAASLAPLAASAQTSEAPSCSERMTNQLRRFNDQCLSDLVSYVAAQPKMAARIASETERYYVVVMRDGDGVRAEAVSKFNYALMKDETANALKQLGWQAPENESDNWRKHFGMDLVRSGAAADGIAKALAAYGLKKDQAITVTVAPDISS